MKERSHFFFEIDRDRAPGSIHHPGEDEHPVFSGDYDTVMSLAESPSLCAAIELADLSDIEREMWLTFIHTIHPPGPGDDILVLQQCELH